MNLSFLPISHVAFVHLVKVILILRSKMNQKWDNDMAAGGSALES